MPAQISRREEVMGVSGKPGKRSHLLTVLVTFAALFLLALIPASAQETGTILGIVKDTSGGVVPNANVTITNTGTNEVRTVATGADGAYRVPALRPGNYTLRVEVQGFQTQTVTGLTLNVAQELVTNVTLQVGAATQQVTVTGEAPIINTTTSSLGSLVNDQRIADLPLNGRNYADLTFIQPGIQVNTSPSGGGSGSSGKWFSSNGMPPRSNNWTIDGALMINQYGTGANSIAGNTLGVDGIKEYRVITNMFSAEYGMGMGSQVVLVSKGGTNNWHGDAFEYLRNNHLDARNFFEAQPSLLGGQRLPQFKRNNFGGSFGGPIRKDKTFFYLVYEGLRTAQQDSIQTTSLYAGCHFVNVDTGSGNVPMIIGGGPITPVVTVPASHAGLSPQILRTRLTGTVTLAQACGNAAAGTVINNMVTPWIGQFPFPNEPGTSPNYTFPGKTTVRDDYSQLRVDQNISDSDTFFGRYTIDDTRLTDPYASLTSSDTGDAYPQYYSIGVSRNQYFTLGENHIFSPNLLNSFRLSFSRTQFTALPGINRVPDLNPDFDLIDSASTPGSTCFATTNPVCIWSYLPGRWNGGLAPGQSVTTLSFNTTLPTYHPQNIWTLADDIFVTHGKHAFKLGTLMNNFQEPSVMQKGAYGSTNSRNSITNWLAGRTSSYLTVTPVPGFATNGLLNPPLQGYYLDRDYMFKTFGFYAQDDYRVTSRLTLNLGLRYEFMTVPHELYGRSSIISDLQGGSSTYVLGRIFNRNWTTNNWSPRIGFAWDVFGTGKTSIRSGFGIYYDIANIGSMLTQAANGVPPFGAQTQLAFSGNLLYTIPFIDVNGVPVSPSFPLAQFGKALQMNDPNLQSPHVLQYNLTVEQQLPLGIGLQVSYVGNRGINLYALVEGNPVKPKNIVNGAFQFDVTKGQAGCYNNALSLDPTTGAVLPLVVGGVTINPGDPGYPCRMNPFFGSALFITSPSNSWYNALQILVTRRMARGLDFQGSYAFAKSLDTTGGQMYNTDCGFNAGVAIGNHPWDLHQDKGLSCSDVPHSLRMSVLYHFPTISSTGFVGKLVNGWWMGNIVSMSQGFPFTPVVTTDRSFGGNITQGNSTLPSLNTSAVSCVNGVPAGCPTTGTYNFIPFDPNTVVTGNPKQWFDPLMFGVAPLGQIGNAPRNFVRTPGSGTWDFSLVKDTKLGFLGEEGNLQFRAEVFNVTNRANFGLPTSTVFSANTTSNCPSGAVSCNLFAPFGTAGQITTTSTTSRQIQFALKVVF
jgi:hypothetical protein